MATVVFPGHRRRLPPPRSSARLGPAHTAVVSSAPTHGLASRCLWAVPGGPHPRRFFLCRVLRTCADARWPVFAMSPPCLTDSVAITVFAGPRHTWLISYSRVSRARIPGEDGARGSSSPRLFPQTEPRGASGTESHGHVCLVAAVQAGPRQPQAPLRCSRAPREAGREGGPRARRPPRPGLLLSSAGLSFFLPMKFQSDVPTRWPSLETMLQTTHTQNPTFDVLRCSQGRGSTRCCFLPPVE